MAAQVRVGGQWLSTIAGWGELTWSTLAAGGSGQCEWSMTLPAGFSHPALRRGRTTEVLLGSGSLWRGVLAEPSVDDSGTWSFHADGYSTSFGGWAALDGSGNLTTVPDAAIDAAIGRGAPWTRPVSLSSVAFGDGASDNDSLATLGGLLDAWSASAGKRWGVDGTGAVYGTTDPLTAGVAPKWHMTPGSGRFGLADDSYASNVYLRYRTSASAYATATASDPVAAANYGRQEVLLDGTGYGIITATQATALASGSLSRGRARLGWTNPVSPSRFQLTTPGGQPASLPLVAGGDVVRLHGVIDEQGQPKPYVDFVIGETSYAADSDAITLTPVGMAARDLASVMALAVQP